MLYNSTEQFTKNRDVNHQFTHSIIVSSNGNFLDSTYLYSFSVHKACDFITFFTTTTFYLTTQYADLSQTQHFSQFTISLIRLLTITTSEIQDVLVNPLVFFVYYERDCSVFCAM